MMYGGDDMAVCDGSIFNKTYVDTKAFANGQGELNYVNPAEQKYGQVIDVTKQAVGGVEIVPEGTVVQTLEGPKTVGAGDVVCYDVDGNAYVSPLDNVLKRNVVDAKALLKQDPDLYIKSTLGKFNTEELLKPENGALRTQYENTYSEVRGYLGQTEEQYMSPTKINYKMKEARMKYVHSTLNESGVKISDMNYYDQKLNFLDHVTIEYKGQVYQYEYTNRNAFYLGEMGDDAKEIFYEKMYDIFINKNQSTISELNKGLNQPLILD